MNYIYPVFALLLVALPASISHANDPYAAQKAYFQEAQNQGANRTADGIVDEGVDRLDSLLKDGNLDGFSGSSPKKDRKVLKDRSLVNGIQGRYMPKKVWEDDVDNQSGVNLLKKSDNRVLSREAQGKISAPKKAWEE